MLADIRSPVHTAFGTYVPEPVQVVPCVPLLDVAGDFSNVVNFDRFSFSEQELAFLRRNHFVVVPGRPVTETQSGAYREMFDVYNEARELGIPILVTSDALLHTFHLVFDRILMSLETRRFYGWLDGLLRALYHETLVQQDAAADTLARWALWRNVAYLNVARSLLDSTFAPARTSGLYERELELIRQHAPFTGSPVFAYPEDYTQYIPRGHYTRSDSLRHYFLAMMWLGRMAFDRRSSGLTLAALFLTQALARTEVDGLPARQVWDAVYQPTVFFVGKSDDLTPQQYLAVAQQVYGPGFASLAPDALADSSRLAQFVAAVRALPGPKIEYPGQPAGFRLMGQRFIPDSYVLDELVFDKLPDPRSMPRGLDVMAVLGSQRAWELLQQTPDWTAYPSYPVRLDSLRREFASYPDTVWAQNVYWNWLYCLMPLLVPKGPGYPDWMQTLAWLDRDLYAALASWAELRHDTILYAKQSGTETGVKPAVLGKQGYVEPNVYLYARLASLARFLRTGLSSRNLLFADFTASVDTLHSLLLRLKTISEKELRNESPTRDEYQTILMIGSILQEIAEGVSGPSLQEDEEEMPVVADVHTDQNTNTVLEVGVGYPYFVYAICPVEGQLVLTRGAGFSYYEFTWPSTDRLTDEAWRETLKRGEAAGRPAWVASFVADTSWAPGQSESYLPLCSWVQMPDVRPVRDTLAVGDTLWVNISAYHEGGEVRVWLENRIGARIPGDVLSNPSGWTLAARIPTEAATAGDNWVVVEVPAVESPAPDSVVLYRKHVFLMVPHAV
ncbi:MAG TPA: DUF3160 domain-containing protein, partial [Bacteroidetes bacterium]|nr:DUF3160 domain-containing protein [Bacteroidota bacterium]